jgi:glycosyltransferase involved in cell wall biosynthesis
MKVFINPPFNQPDVGEGGIRRVVEGQRKHLPAFGVEVVDREQDADLVACHASAHVTTSKPVVAHCHGLYWQEYPWDVWSHAMNGDVINVLRRADAVTAPSNWVGYILRRGMNLAAQTIYHGIDAAEWEPGDKSHQYVLWNKSRVDPICDPEPLNALVGLLPDVKFVSTFGAAAPNLVVTGKLPHEQAKRQVERASVYLCTARETFGIGTLEAMACGAVVVGYDWGGQAEIITNGVDGILVKPGDVAALALAVKSVLEYPQDYALHARETVEQRFTWEQAAERYAKVYLDTYEGRSPKRVSVVITCYNLAASLPRAVASVDMADAEIVVVDDASPDETGDVAKRLADADDRIRVVTNPSNLYLAGSLDAGIRVSTGRYIVPLDADNELAPGALDTLADALDGDQEIDVAYGSMRLVQEWEGGSSFQSGWPGAFVYEQQLGHRNQIPSTSMYRRKWWERGGGYRRRCRTAEDADFWCRITSLGAKPKKVTDSVTLIYHERQESMSHVEADWAWEAWYPWGRAPHLTPWGAPAAIRKSVPTYEPAQVTVVIPVGAGHEKYLYDAFDSLVAQTFVGWRCVVVDDRPGADNWESPLHLPPWAERWITGGPGPNGGPARARNTGIEAAKTPYVLLLDADDYLAPNALESLLYAANTRDALGAKEYIYSDWYKQEQKQVYQAPDFVAENLRGNLTHSVTALYPTAGLLAVGGFDENLDSWEDWDLILKLIEAGYCGVRVPLPLLYYRYGTGARREALYKDRVRHLEVMRAKWHELMVEQKPMACGCAGGRTTYSPPVLSGGLPLPVVRDGMTMIEFTGTSAPRTYRGASGREYRFGSDSGHKRHYVANEDLPTFDNRLGFRLAVADADGFAMMDAVGPPDRMASFVLA